MVFCMKVKDPDLLQTYVGHAEPRTFWTKWRYFTINRWGMSDGPTCLHSFLLNYVFIIIKQLCFHYPFHCMFCSYRICHYLKHLQMVTGPFTSWQKCRWVLSKKRDSIFDGLFYFRTKRKCIMRYSIHKFFNTTISPAHSSYMCGVVN